MKFYPPPVTPTSVIVPNDNQVTLGFSTSRYPYNKYAVAGYASIEGAGWAPRGPGTGSQGDGDFPAWLTSGRAIGHWEGIRRPLGVLGPETGAYGVAGGTPIAT